jgi:CRP-like cAMP-binding protein
MDAQSTGYLWWAVALGGISAASLPMGSAVGLLTSPSSRTLGVLAAFGAGALLAALSVELVAPTVEAATGDEGALALVTLVSGAVLGGALFVFLDQLVSQRGGFLRKSSTAISWFRRRRAQRAREVLEHLCRMPLLRTLDPDEVSLVVADVTSRPLTSGEVLFREGQPGDAIYFVKEGELALERHGQPYQTAHAGEVIGEMALLTGAPRSATARALGPVEVLVLSGDDFERWRALCPALDEAVRGLAAERLALMADADRRNHSAEHEWAEAAVEALRGGQEIPTIGDMREAREEHRGAGLAIWLGILLDGIPESLVVGAGFLGLLTARLAEGGAVAFADVVPYTLLAGLFLSNFPEALSSSAVMRLEGWSRPSIFGLWSFVTGVTAAGAGLGYLLGGVFDEQVRVGVEGIAAGAMLTMVASTMIPESVHLGGRNTVGITTLLGFLAAISFKLLE